MVISGKGGVGKTTISVALALGLRDRRRDQDGPQPPVGLLDADLTGSNIPAFFDGHVTQEMDAEGDDLIPAVSEGIEFVSMEQITDARNPVLWAGDAYRDAADQFFERTRWTADHLVVDAPPGTGNEPQELLPRADRAIVVTMPSDLAHDNADQALEMCREVETPVAGMIQNFDHTTCPSCGEQYRIWPDDDDDDRWEDIPVLARLPMDPAVAERSALPDLPMDVIMDAIRNPVTLKKGRHLRSKALKMLGGKLG